MRVELLLGRLGVAVAVICATVVTATAVALPMPSVQVVLGIGPKPIAPSYVAGGQIDLPLDVLGSSPSTLVIFFDSSCGVCERNKPVLAKLVARESSNVHVIAVTGEANRAEALAFAKNIGLSPSQLVTMDLKRLRLHTVPTTVLVDRSGTIRNAVEGAAPPQAQDELLRLMLVPSATR